MSDKTVALPEARKHAGFLKANLREYGMLPSLGIDVERRQVAVMANSSAPNVKVSESRNSHIPIFLE